MDVISTIKIRNADGTYSDSMPIGTVSDYITVVADGSSLSSILGNVNLNKYGSLQSQINALGGGSGVADGVVYVGEDPEDTGEVPIEKINGISFDAKGEVLTAYWEHEGVAMQAQLAPSTGGGGFNDIYTETSMNLGRVEDSTIGEYSVTGGFSLEASGKYSIAFGYGNKVEGAASFAEGNNNTIGVANSSWPDNIAACHAEGLGNKIESGYGHHIEGQNNKIQNESNGNGGFVSHVEGYGNVVVGSYKHVEGYENKVTLDSWNVHVEGQRHRVLDGYGQIHVEGFYHELNAQDIDSVHVEGKQNYLKENATAAHIEGRNCHGAGEASHTEGYGSYANYLAAHAEGYSTKASQQGAHSEGYSTEASAQGAHAEGSNTKAAGSYSHAEGYQTETAYNGYAAHAEGYYTQASRSAAHAEGYQTKASGDYSHAEGFYSEAKGQNSHAEGIYTLANGDYSNPQHVQGKYNIEDTESKYAHIVGGGSSESSRKNIHTLDWNGNAWFFGMVRDGKGASINGIEFSDNGILNSSAGGFANLNQIIGSFQQKTTEGYNLYHFYDCTETQNGLTIIFKDGICTYSGTAISNTYGEYVFTITFNELDLSIFGDSAKIYAKNRCYLNTYDLNGNLLEEGVTYCNYSNTTIGKIIPQVKVVSWYYKEEGESFIPMISTVYSSKTEIYTGGKASPNPNYPQEIVYPIFTSLITENINGNQEIQIKEDNIELYQINDIKNIITSTSIIKYLEKVTLTGEEVFEGDAEAGYFIYTPSAPGKINSVNILSDHYRNVNGDLSETDYNIFVDANGNIRIQHSGFASIDEYKIWLASNNVIIIYERAEAEIISLLSEVSAALKNIEFYSGETSISVNSTTILPTIEVNYPTSLTGKYVIELLARVAELEAKVN